MKASVKRIIWALGWAFVWAVNDYAYYLIYKIAPSDFSEAVSSLIWIIPLIIFKDDKEKK